LLEYGTIARMEWSMRRCWQGPLRVSLAAFAVALAGWGQPPSRGQAQTGQTAQAAPQNDPANQHTISVTFSFDFGKSPSCGEKPALKTCVKQFVVYDVSGKRFRLFAVPVPEGARGYVNNITGESPTRIFLPGKHFIAVTAQNAAGAESDLNAAKVVVQVKPKAVESSSPVK
jgi:hypothetical protein